MSTELIQGAFDKYQKSCMTADGWRQILVHASESARNGDDGPLGRVCELLAELSQATCAPEGSTILPAGVLAEQRASAEAQMPAENIHIEAPPRRRGRKSKGA